MVVMSKIWVEIGSARRSRGAVTSSAAAETAVPAKLRVLSVYLFSCTLHTHTCTRISRDLLVSRIGMSRYIFLFVRVSFACVFVVAVNVDNILVVVLYAYVHSCCACRSGI